MKSASLLLRLLGILALAGTAVCAQINQTNDFQALKAKAESGDAPSQFDLGAKYYYGQGVGLDYVEAVKWYHKAADQGNAFAQNNLGTCYDRGTGVTQNYSEAVKLYRKAADQGLAGAQSNLGSCYYYGRGVLRDYGEAASWFRKAADQGFAEAEDGLGGCYANGEGVPKDYVEAYKWLNLALAQGEENARDNLSNLEGFMTPEQIAEAQRLARDFKPQPAMTSVFTIPEKTLTDSSPTCTGSGFFITDDGYLISDYHVVKDAKQVRLVTRKGIISAKVVLIDAANDLALLKAEGRFASLPIKSSRTMKLGNTVATVGFPDIGLQGFAPKLAKGEIAALSGAQDDPRYFQISVPVQPGNSGGALVDERGNVIGIVSAKLDALTALTVSGSLPENVNYSVKSSFLLSFLESVPQVSSKLQEPITADRKFEDVVESAQAAAALLLVY